MEAFRAMTGSLHCPFSVTRLAHLTQGLLHHPGCWKECDTWGTATADSRSQHEQEIDCATVGN